MFLRMDIHLTLAPQPLINQLVYKAASLATLAIIKRLIGHFSIPTY